MNLTETEYEVDEELCKIVRQQADYLRNCTIDVDEAFEWVSITDDEGMDIYMQGEEAAEFIEEATKLWNTAGGVTEEECYASIAVAHVDSCD